ncbi:thioredoxin domain-containing protein [Candidatus Woesearchaeota archaeon]|nr:thioredoxin domain-containing protein [Candidatus Woesearchaeota archaeon]
MQKKIYWTILSILAIILLFFAVKYSLDSQKSNARSNQDYLQISPDEPVKGDSNASTTIIIYSDPSCPFCAAAAGQNQQVISYLKSKMPDWEAPVPNIIKNYVDTGKVRLVFRYSPGHGTGEEAMKILFCANEQGKFWELHDVIFAHQEIVADIVQVKLLAQNINVDMTKLNICHSSNKYAAKLKQDTASAQALDVKGTPSFLINGQLISGAQPYQVFEKILNQ